MRHRVLGTLALVAGAFASAARQGYTFIDVTIPSASANPGGIVARVAVPATPRLVNGAPVAIFVPGGGGADAFQIRDDAAGVISITFAFPGGELGGRRSGGTADTRGPVSLRALADVVQFALGRVRAMDGRLLRDLSPYPVLDNVGLVGWSRGGDAVVNVLARYSAETRGVKWIVTHESPGFDSAMLGEIVLRTGTTLTAADYVAGTCALLACRVLYPNLRWNANSQTGGTLYLDRNGSGRAEATIEPALPATLLPGTTRRVFTLAATEAAAASRAFGATWPANVATLDEAREYWSWRDVRWNFSALIAAHPDLAAILHATEHDHVQSAVDHPHIALVYNGLRFGGARWVRVNPDGAYTHGIASNLPDNAANSALPSDFASWLVPEAQANDTRIVNAAITELSDRVHFGRWEENLDAPLLSSASTNGVTTAASAASVLARRVTSTDARGLEGSGSITFAVNVHDWKHPHESADTILRAVDVFVRHGVRGDFYLTGPMVDFYATHRPEVIDRLRETQMTISYHVRPPASPLCRLRRPITQPERRGARAGAP